MERKAVLALAVSCCLVGLVSVAQAKCNRNEEEKTLYKQNREAVTVCYRLSQDTSEWESMNRISIRGAYNLAPYYNESGPKTCLF
jgi:hypothetical protein